MKVWIENTEITLTPEQVAQIQAERKKTEEARGSFEKMLVRFGFTKVDTTDWEYPNQDCWEHKHRNWFGEIINRGCYFECWLVGAYLKTSRMNDGWVYSEPEEVAEAISDALRQYATEK